MLCALLLSFLAASARGEAVPAAEHPGRIDGWNYSQDYFGLSWTLPEEASIQGAAFTKKLMHEGMKEFASGPMGAALQESVGHTHTLLTLTMEPASRKARDGVVIVAAAERLPDAAGIETGADYFRMMLETIQATGIPYAPRGEPKRESLGGRPFDTAAFDVGVGTDPAKLMGNEFYAAVRGNYALAFSLVYDTEEGRRKGREILAQVRFSTASWPLEAAPAPVVKPAPSKKLAEEVKEAYRHQMGQGRAPDPAKAVALYRRAAEAGSAEAQARLGALYAAGTGVPKDDAEAARLYAKASSAGLAWAQEIYAQILFEGRGTKQDLAESAKWRRKAARQGNVDAMYNMAALYAEGQGVERSDFESGAWLNQAARHGSVDALRILADNAYRGAGVPRSAEAAYRYFAYAAQLGDAESQYRAGFMSSMGDGTPQDNAAAIALFEKAAEQGHVKAQEELTSLYGAGLGVEKDRVKSLKWARAAAEQGSSLGQLMLGLSYLNGEDVAQDYAEGARWLLKASESGDPQAQELLAGLYDKGQGVARDEKEAARWRAKAAAKR